MSERGGEVKREKGLIEKAMKAFDYIIQYKVVNDGNSSTVREIGEAIGVRAVSHVHYLVKDLAKHGMIELVKGRRGVHTGERGTVEMEGCGEQ